MSNIVLIGFMGSGKSNTGIELSKYLQKYYFIDSDNLISAQAKMSINEIFKTYGEDYFRKLEAQFINWGKRNLNNAIISTGGGMPIFNPLKEMGKVFFLEVSFENILSRISEAEISQRPLFKDKKLAYELFKSRESVYKNCCDVVINANLSIKEISNQILTFIN